MRIHTKFNGYEAGRRLYFKGGGGGGQVKYDNLETLYAEQANSARLLRSIAEQNLPGATQAYVGEAQNVLAPDYANRQASRAGADMAGANAMERAATERNLASMGVNPNDPRFAGSMRSTQLNNAARMAAGKNIARNEADQFQLNVAKDAVGTFTGQSNNAATQMGNAASGLGSVYASQANQKMAQDQQQSSAVGNAVAGGLMAYSMFKDGGKVCGAGMKVLRRADGGGVGQSYDDYAGAQVAPSEGAGGYQGITPEQWSAAAAAQTPAQAAPQSQNLFSAGLYYDRSGNVKRFAPLNPSNAQGNMIFTPLAKIRNAQMQREIASGGWTPLTAMDGGKVVERHMLGGSAGSQQGNSGFFQMQSIAPPPSFQAPQQQGGSPVNMQTIQAAKKIKDGGGMKGAQARATDKIGNVVGKFDSAAGNQIQSRAAGMGMDPSQANAAADAYVEAASNASDPALAQSYRDAAANIKAGAGLPAADAAGFTAANAAAAEASGAGALAAGAEAGAAAGAAAEGAALGSGLAGGTAAAAGDAALAGSITSGAGALGTGAAAGGASALGTGAAAGATGAGALGATIGAALPWVGAAFAVGSLLDWWADGGEVGTQNAGMSEEEAMRRFSQAFNGGDVEDMRDGRKVPGEWAGNTDNVPAMLTEQEFVLNAEATALADEKALESLNAKGLALREAGYTPNDIKRGVGLRAQKKVAA